LENLRPKTPTGGGTIGHEQATTVIGEKDGVQKKGASRVRLRGQKKGEPPQKKIALPRVKKSTLRFKD